jgi:putative ABC transport system permease protein
MLLRKAFQDIVTRRVRSALTLIGVVVGVAGLVAIITMSQGFAREQRQLFATGERADLAIYLYNAPESLIRVIERVPGVLAADLRYNHYGQGRLATEPGWEDIHFLGIRDFEAQVADRLVLEAGQWPQQGEALIEPAAADQYNLRPGDTIQYRDAANRAQLLQISGIGRLPNAISADITGIPLIFVHAPVVRSILDVPGYNELLVLLEPAVQRAEVGEGVVRELERRLIPRGEPRFSDPENFVGKRELDALFLALYLFSGLGVLLSGFLVANTLAALVAESVREIGIMKSLGATRSQVLLSFLLAASLYGIAGTLIGLAAGSGLGFVLLRVLGRVASLAPPFRLEPLALFLGSVVGVVVTLLGGLLPAWRASNITAKEALESLGVSRNFGRSRIDRLVQRLAALPPLPAMGIRNLLRRKGRSLVTLVVVALAVAALLAAQSTDQSVADAIDTIFETYPADAYLQFGEPVTAMETGALRRATGVRDVEGWLLRQCTAAYTRTRCWAFPPDTVLYHPALVAGQWLDPREPHSVVITDDLAAAQRLGIGATFPLRHGNSERLVTVRGIVRDNAIFLGSDIQSKVFVPYTTFASMLGQRNPVDVFAFSVAPRSRVEQQVVLEEVDRKLAPLRPRSTLALTEFEKSQEQTRILTAALRGMVLLVAIVGAAGLVNTLALNVLERRREIGVLRTLGIDDPQLASLFVTEGLGLGTLGWILGLLLGWIMGFFFVRALSTTLFLIPFSFPLALLFSSLLFALLLSLVASVVPAFAAARIPTGEAIRYE